MKFIRTIQAEHFKGRDFKIELAPVTVIVGDNFTCKTGITEAIKVFLLGYSPKHGKQPGRTFGFAGAPSGASSMSVRGVFSDGQEHLRAWEMKKGSVKQTGFEGQLCPPVLLDANEWLGKSGPARVQFVFSQIDLKAAGYTTEKVTARLKADVKVENPDEVSERILGGLVEDVETLAETREEMSLSFQDWLDRVAQAFKDKAAAAKAVMDDMAGTVQGMTQLRAAEGLQANPNVTAELEAARKRHQTAVSEKNTLDKQQTDYTGRAARKKQLNDQIAGLIDKAPEIEALKMDIAAMESRTKAHKSETVALLPKLAAAQAAKDKATDAIEDRKKWITQKSEQAAKDLALDCCPKCKSKGKKWKESFQASIDAEVGVLDAEIGNWQKALAEAEAARVEWQAKVDAAQAADKEIDAIRQKHFEAGRRLAVMEKTQNEFTNLKGRLEELADIGQPPDAGAQADAAQAAEEAREEVERLEGEERQQVGAMQDAKREEEARQKHAEKITEQQVCKLALEVLATLRTEAMDAAFGGFMEKMNLLADGILPGKLEFRDGEIGYFAGASFATLQYFSGTEEMLTFAGLSLTLAQSSPFKIVIMDELGRVKSHRKIKLIERMLDLQRQGVIDQFIGVDVDAGAYVKDLSSEPKEPRWAGPQFALVETK